MLIAFHSHDAKKMRNKRREREKKEKEEKEEKEKKEEEREVKEMFIDKVSKIVWLIHAKNKALGLEQLLL